MLIPVLPDTPGKANALARAAQVTDIRWTPLRDVPTYTKQAGKTVHPAGVEVTGLPYSSPEPTDTFILENISISTFLSAVSNPDSALYHRDLKGHRNSWTYFGVVCNSVARHALNIRRRFSTKRFMTVPGMRFIAPAGCYRPEDVQLCDVLWVHSAERSHVALITGIFTDETGQIREIEVSEGIRPHCVRISYPLEQYFEHFSLFHLLRYELLEQVPPPDPIQIPEPKSIGVDYGDRSNYLYGDHVVLSVFSPEPRKILLSQEGEADQTLEIRGSCTLQPEPGSYTATDPETGDQVRFRVCRPDIQYQITDGLLTVQAASSDPHSRVLYLDLREASKTAPEPSGQGSLWRDPRTAALAQLVELTQQERESGVFTRPIHPDARNLKVVYENDYGIWTHRILPLFQPVRD